MNLEQQPNKWSIDLNELIKEIWVDITELKKSLNDINSNTNQVQVVSEKLQLLDQEKTRATDEQLQKIRKLQDEFNVINSTKESITALRSHINKKSTKNTQSYQLPTIKLDDRFTETEVVVNRIGPINKVKEQIEKNPIAWAFSLLLNKIWITDSTDSIV